MTTPHEAPKKRQLPTVYTLLFIIIALMAALTWVLPAGKYDYVTAKSQQPVAAATVADYSGDERLLPVPGSYTELPSQPQGVFEVLKAPIQGFHKAADVALFVLIIGGFLAVTMQSGALDAGVGAIVRT
ncbi:MAG: YfcC family protein, partial [Aeromonas sp.]|nr:YfcC family protein [Aeromonas sp.]